MTNQWQITRTDSGQLIERENSVKRKLDTQGVIVQRCLNHECTSISLHICICREIRMQSYILESSIYSQVYKHLFIFSLFTYLYL